MKKAIMLLTVFMFVCGLMSCALNEKKLQETGGQLLSQNDLTELFNKNLAVRFTGGGLSNDGYYLPDGTQKISWPGGEDEGRYRIENGQFCSKWKVTRDGKEECYKIYHTKDNKYVWVKLDGSYDSTMVIKE
jgi:hypothetical protein